MKCTVRCCPDHSLREVCLVDEYHGAASCEAEMPYIVQVSSLVATDRGPVIIQGCPPILFNAYSDWCRAIGRPLPLIAVVFDEECLRQLIHEASFMGVGSVDPFSTVDYLVQRLRRFRHQSWLMQLPRFHLCLETGVVLFGALCDVMCFWNYWRTGLTSSCAFLTMSCYQRKASMLSTWTPSCAPIVLRCPVWHFCMLCCCASVPIVRNNLTLLLGIMPAGALRTAVSFTGVC